VKFYHRTTRTGARGILNEGFRDGRGGYGFLDQVVGVWLSNEPLTENEGARGGRAHLSAMTADELREIYMLAKRLDTVRPADA
jgi:hypothetical protein